MMRIRELSALAAAVFVIAAPGYILAAPGQDDPMGRSAWRAAAPVVNPASGLRNEGTTPVDMLASLALPGLGELRTGANNRAIMHFAAEAAVWISFVVFRIQGDLRKDDYIEYAEVYAGVQRPGAQAVSPPEGRFVAVSRTFSYDDDYYRNLSRYRRSDPGPNSYNEKEVREVARVLFPDDPQARQRYIKEHEIGHDDPRAWSWESDEHWAFYRELRRSSQLSYQRSRFSIAAAVANRIISVVGLTWGRGPGGTEIGVGMEPLGGDRQLVPAVSLCKRF